MAGINLTNTQGRTTFFQQTILNNLRYWQGWLAEKPLSEVAALDRERTAIVRAISFAFELDNAWPLAFDLIQTFSPFMERRGHWESWNWLLTRALETAKRIEDAAAEVTLSVLLARLSFQQSRAKESVYYYRRAIHLARQLGDQFNEARACTNLGYYFVEQGYWHRAEVLCCYALELFEQLDSDHGRAHTENHLGVLYIRQERWKKAKPHLEQACEIWKTMGDKPGLTLGYLNFGMFYLDTEQFNQALEYLKKALNLAQQAGEKTTVGKISVNIGKAYRLLRNTSQAVVYLKQAEVIFEQYSSLSELGRVWNELGLLYCQKDKWPEAMPYLEKSLDTWRSLGIKFEEIEVLLDIGECELLRGNRIEATMRLQETKQLIGSNLKRGPYRHLQPRLEKFRRSLTEYVLGQAATN